MDRNGAGSRYFSSEIVNTWWSLKNDQWNMNRYNIENILPESTGLLRGQLSRSLGAKGSRYESLVVLLGASPIPALMIANAIRPGTLWLLHTPDKEEAVAGLVGPNLAEGVALETVLLDQNDHNGNNRVIQELLARLKKKRGRTLCDVTGGKKMMAALLSIAARDSGMDISYIDARRYMPNSGVPVPGEEALFIHRHRDRHISEIAVAPYARIIINYVDTGAGGQFIFQVHTETETRKFTRDMTGSDKGALEKEINALYASINDRITCSRAPERELGELRGLVKNLLFPAEFEQCLGELREQGLVLILDREAAGVPWETALPATELPVIRKLYNALPLNRDEGEPKTDLLLVFGSGEGIAGFDGLAGKMKLALRGSPAGFETCTAESSGDLKVHLAKKRYSAIFYFGHARFSSDPCQSGWVCRNGETFGSPALTVINGRAPEIIVSSACESARTLPFINYSFADGALAAGCGAYIGTNWLLETERSVLFLTRMIEEVFTRGSAHISGYMAAMGALREKFGEGDISRYNYVYYGR